jgi:hypothetical protein
MTLWASTAFYMDSFTLHIHLMWRMPKSITQYIRNVFLNMTVHMSVFWLAKWRSSQLWYKLSFKFLRLNHYRYNSLYGSWPLHCCVTIVFLPGWRHSLTPIPQRGGWPGRTSSDTYSVTCLSWVALPGTHVTASISLWIVEKRKPLHDKSVILEEEL